MPHTTGVVEAVSVKEMPSADKFGNTHRANIKVGEDWYSYGTLKKPEINIKDGDSWKKLQKGFEVEFMYAQNGDFRNIQKKSFSITGEPRQSTAKPQAQSKPQGSSKSFVNPAQRGQAMNLAVEVLGYKAEDFADEKKVVEAIQWYITACDVFEALWDKAEKDLIAKNQAVPEEEEEDTPFEPDYDGDDVY